MKKRKDIIRVGDLVRVVNPRVVSRVGYPKCVKDYEEAAWAKYGDLLRKDMRHTRCIEKAIQQIAYGLAKADGFGGKERTLHFEGVPLLVGQEFRVQSVRMVQTGTYYPPRVSRSYFGETDYEPGGLENMKSRRLVSGVQSFGLLSLMGGNEIDSEDLIKVTNTQESE